MKRIFFLFKSSNIEIETDGRLITASSTIMIFDFKLFLLFFCLDHWNNTGMVTQGVATRRVGEQS